MHAGPMNLHFFWQIDALSNAGVARLPHAAANVNNRSISYILFSPKLFYTYNDFFSFW